MFPFLVTAQEANRVTVSHRLLFSQDQSPSTGNALTGLPRFFPICFARATNGYVYMATGLTPVTKWDGLRAEAITAGVPAPAAALTLAATGNGDISGRYTAYQRFIDADGNPSNLSPVSNEIVVTDVATVLYTDVEVPTDKKIVTRQILRNTDGQSLTYYVDVETTDLNLTSFSSTKLDTELRLGVAVPLFDTEDRSLANRFGVPRNDKPLIAYYNSRLFLAGDITYAEGHIEVTNGSTTVYGIGTEWTDSFTDRFLYIVGHDRSYEIASVDTDNQTLTLESAFRGTTDTLAEYAIRSAPAQRTLMYFTESGRFDAWPAVNSLEISSSEDLEEEITALLVSQSFLYIIQRRHIYRMTFLADPLTDGGVFLAARRGCINNRCWVNVDGWTYMIDDRGAYRFDGSDQVEELSMPIQDIFWNNREGSDARINWKASRLFHASHDRDDATVRWFVALSGQRVPRHALCFNYQNQQWWIEEYPWPVGASELVRRLPPRAILSGPPRRVYTTNVGTLDGPNQDAGDTRCDVLSAGPCSVTTQDAIFPVSGVVGNPIAIVEGRGKGQVRVVSSVSGQTVRTTQRWSIRPDTTSVFQLGGIRWKWLSGWFNWAFKEEDQVRRIIFGFQPVTHSNTFDLRVYRDYAESPEVWQLTWPNTPAEASGVETTRDDPDAVFDLTQEKGYAHLRLDSWKSFDEWRRDIISLELRGFSGHDHVQIFGGVIQGGKQ